MKKYVFRTVKLKLYPDAEQEAEIMNFIKNGVEAQTNAMNIITSQLVSAFFEAEKDVKNAKFKRNQKEILLNTNPALKNIEFAKGADTKTLIQKKVLADFNKNLKKLAAGTSTCNTYSQKNGLLIRSRNINFDHNCKDDEELEKMLFSNKLRVKVRVLQYNFDVELGQKNITKEKSVRNIIKNIFLNENVKICESKLLVKKNRKRKEEIFLYLTIQMPVQNHPKLDPKKSAGVDLGLRIPGVVATDDGKYLKIGCEDDFLRLRMQIKSQRNRLKRQLKKKGSKSYKYQILRNKERRFVEFYYSVVAKEVVNFAIKNSCGTIKLEDLSSYSKNQFILNSWSYYTAQEKIKNLAESNGITVKFINAMYTSQICSCCSSVGKRNGSKFKCHHCGREINADVNAAINIARSENFKKKEDLSVSERLEIAREYYRIKGGKKENGRNI